MSNFNRYCESDPSMFRVIGINPVVIEEVFHSGSSSFDLSVTTLGDGVAQVTSNALEYKGTIEWEEFLTDSSFMKTFACWKTQKGHSLITWWTKLRNSGLLTTKGGVPFDGNTPSPSKPIVMKGTIRY